MVVIPKTISDMLKISDFKREGNSFYSKPQCLPVECNHYGCCFPDCCKHKIDCHTDEVANLVEALIAELREIVESVANIGVDFGYGTYELQPETIEKARQLLGETK